MSSVQLFAARAGELEIVAEWRKSEAPSSGGFWVLTYDGARLLSARSYVSEAEATRAAKRKVARLRGRHCN